MSFRFSCSSEVFRRHLLAFVRAHWDLAIKTYDALWLPSVVWYEESGFCREINQDRLLPHRNTIAALIQEGIYIDAALDFSSDFIKDFYSFSFAILLDGPDDNLEEVLRVGAKHGDDYTDGLTVKRRDQLYVGGIKKVSLVTRKSPFFGSMSGAAVDWIMDKRQFLLLKREKDVLAQYVDEGSYFVFLVIPLIIGGNKNVMFRSPFKNHVAAWQSLDASYITILRRLGLS